MGGASLNIFVIISVYNVERFLAACLDRIGVNFSLELIIWTKIVFTSREKKEEQI